MKVSVILPTLYPNLAERAIASLRQTGAPDVDLQIVVCSPHRIGGDMVTWVDDADCNGNNAAVRKALEAVEGDYILTFTDDATVSPGWLAKALEAIGSFGDSRPRVLSLNHGEVGTCFGRLYANFPFVSRSVLERFRSDFYPFGAHWGDVSLSMAVWEAGGEVTATADRLVTFETDRMGNGESPHRSSSFMRDTKAFLARFAGTMGDGWPVENFRQYNVDLPVAALDADSRTINLPSRGQFMAAKLNGTSPMGDWFAGGMWFMPTHGKYERCQKTLDAIAAVGTVTKGLVLVNGGTQPEGYDRLRLPDGWTVAFHTDDVSVCDMYRWFGRRYRDLNWLGVIPDDVYPEKGGWDVELVTTAGDRLIATGNDGWQNGQNDQPRRMHGAMVFGGELIRKTGYLCIEGLVHNCFDDLWETYGRELGIWRLRMDVSTPHDHPWKSGDTTRPEYQKTLRPIENDRAVFNKWVARQKDADFARVQPLYPEVRRIDADLRGLRVAIATPCHDGKLLHQYFTSFVSTICMFQAAGISYDAMVLPNESLIGRARNAILKQFLAGSCDYLLMIDADMGWDAMAVHRLLSYKKDVVAAAGRRKSDHVTFCVNPEGPPLRIDPGTGLIAAKEVGAAFMLLSRSVVERAMRVYERDLTYVDMGTGVEYVNLFDTRFESGGAPNGKGLMWSEDYEFCKKLRAMGVDVWVDPSVSLAHVGSKAYAGAFIDSLRVAPAQPKQAGAAE